MAKKIKKTKNKVLTNEQFAKAVTKIVGLVKPNKKFKPFAYYDKDGDELEVFFENVNYYGEYKDCHMTLYRAQDDDRIVGVVLTFISDIIDK